MTKVQQNWEVVQKLRKQGLAKAAILERTGMSPGAYARAMDYGRLQ